MRISEAAQQLGQLLYKDVCTCGSFHTRSNNREKQHVTHSGIGRASCSGFSSKLLWFIFPPREASDARVCTACGYAAHPSQPTETFHVDVMFVYSLPLDLFDATLQTMPSHIPSTMRIFCPLPAPYRWLTTAGTSSWLRLRMLSCSVVDIGLLLAKKKKTHDLDTTN
jgi:hypothetical protein